MHSVHGITSIDDNPSFWSMPWILCNTTNILYANNSNHITISQNTCNYFTAPVSTVLFQLNLSNYLSTQRIQEQNNVVISIIYYYVNDPNDITIKWNIHNYITTIHRPSFYCIISFIVVPITCLYRWYKDEIILYWYVNDPYNITIKWTINIIKTHTHHNASSLWFQLHYFNIGQNIGLCSKHQGEEVLYMTIIYFCAIPPSYISITMDHF